MCLEERRLDIFETLTNCDRNRPIGLLPRHRLDCPIPAGRYRQGEGALPERLYPLPWRGWERRWAGCPSSAGETLGPYRQPGDVGLDRPGSLRCDPGGRDSLQKVAFYAPLWDPFQSHGSGFERSRDLGPGGLHPDAASPFATSELLRAPAVRRWCHLFREVLQCQIQLKPLEPPVVPKNPSHEVTRSCPGLQRLDLLLEAIPGLCYTRAIRD